MRFGVGRAAGVEQIGEDGARVAPFEKRAVVAAGDALGEGVEARVEPNHRAVRKDEAAGRRGGERAAARRDHLPALLEDTLDHALLAGAEIGLAEALEDVADRHAGRFFDLGVGIDEGPAQRPGEPAADRGLARAHHADEHDGARLPAPGWRARVLCFHWVHARRYRGEMQGQATRYLKGAMLFGVVAGLAAAGGIPAPAMAEGPTSLLPDALQRAPVVAPAAPVAPRPEPAAPAAPAGAAPAAGTAATGGPTAAEGAPSGETAPAAARPPSWKEKTASVGVVRDPADAGLLTQQTQGLAADSFAASDGRFVTALARRIDAPLASRWAQILVQRALVTRATPPRYVNAADWLAARADALVALGAAADAHRLLQQVDPAGFDVETYRAAFRAAIASADPLALCPIVPAAEETRANPRWLMVDALCQSARDEDFEAATLFDELRANRDIPDVDIGLAEKLAAGFGAGRRDAQIEWDKVTGLDDWRLALAALVGEEIPEKLLDGLPPAATGWLVRMAPATAAERAHVAPRAAAIGAISSAEARRILAQAAENQAANQTGGQQDASEASAGARLRVVANAANQSARRKAFAELLRKKDGDLRYGTEIAAASAVVAIAPTASAGRLAPDIVASLLSAGLPAEALRWWAVAGDLDGRARGELWALLAPFSPGVRGDKGAEKEWTDHASAHRRALVAAGLAGLDGKEGDPARANRWTAALSAARAGDRTGEAILIVAAGLHGRWADVPPDYLQRMVAALKALGFEREARLMVAESARRG